MLVESWEDAVATLMRCDAEYLQCQQRQFIVRSNAKGSIQHPSHRHKNQQGLRRNPRGQHKRKILSVECICIHGSFLPQIVELLCDIWTFVNLSSTTLNLGLRENKNRTCVRYTTEKRREQLKLPCERRHRDTVRPRLGHAKRGATSVRCT